MPRGAVPLPAPAVTLERRCTAPPAPPSAGEAPGVQLQLAARHARRSLPDPVHHTCGEHVSYCINMTTAHW